MRFHIPIVETLYTSNAKLNICKRMRRALVILALFAEAFIQAGCVTACGPVRSVPPQQLALVAALPATYVIRVDPDLGAPVDTPVPADGRVTFDVPVTSRNSTIYCFGLLPLYHYPPPETLRVVRVTRDNRTVRKLSAQQIGQLPTDGNGYHVLKIEK
jgi:hypothetical protein